jgi:hypothetical protein
MMVGSAQQTFATGSPLYRRDQLLWRRRRTSAACCETSQPCSSWTMQLASLSTAQASQAAGLAAP